MKVLHVIPSLSLKHGGPSIALPLIVRSLTSQGVSVDVATTDDSGPGGHMEVPLGIPVAFEGGRSFYFRKQTEFYKFSRPLQSWLKSNIGEYDLVHVHALFSFSSICAGRMAHRGKVPYIVRPLGVLNNWGIRNRRPLLKKLSLRFIERPVLQNAAAMHYTSEQERMEAESIGAVGRPCVIPLGIDFAPFQEADNPSNFLVKWPKVAGRKIVLFLSRLDPKKGLDLLLDGFAQAKQARPDIFLVIAGDGEKEFVNNLRRRADSLGITDDILWTGFLEGEEKRSALSAAAMFALPSYSENFGMAVVEALAAGVPTVITEGVGIAREVKRAEAGLVVEARSGEVAQALLRVLDEPGLAQRLSVNGRNLAQEQYSTKRMGANIIEMYRAALSTTA